MEGGSSSSTAAQDFVEIRAPQPEQNRPPDEIEVVVVTHVEPRRCGPLVQRLSTELPLKHAGATDLSHLKRVKRSAVDDGEDEDDTISQQQEKQKKRKRPPSEHAGSSAAKSSNHKKIRLDVLLGTVLALRAKFKSTSNDSKSSIDDLLPFLQTYVDDAATEGASSSTQRGRPSIQRVRVPGRRGETQDEWNAFNATWPVLYFPNKTHEHLESALALSSAELEQMQGGMEAAILDATRNHNAPEGAVVVSPESGTVISTSFQERELQESALKNSAVAGRQRNPLSTSILLAIQGVSRLEREAAASAGGLHTDAFQRGQYLCTGYDLYTVQEPSVWESMALVHARIRRVVFGCSRSNHHHHPHHERGLTEHHVHALPGTNHNYRAFACQPGSELWQRCQSLVVQGDNRESNNTNKRPDSSYVT